MGTAQIMMIIISILLITGIMIPYVQDAFSGTSTDVGTDQLVEELGEGGGVSFLSVLFSVGKMFFWTFGDLPFWLDGFFLLLRIALYVMIALAIRGVG